MEQTWENEENEEQQRVLLDLVDRGLISMTWDDELEDIVYFLTPKQRTDLLTWVDLNDGGMDSLLSREDM
tara:strand:+ start:426 stop:635 length:210 start_codon:yes stop_codon:yes gene_type:complete